LSAVVEDDAVRFGDALHARAQELRAHLDADALAISRVVGDVLIVVAHDTADGVTLQFGQGFLVSDYPVTRRVLEQGEPAALTLADVDADEGESRVLRELGFASLAMLPFDVGGERWGLVEAYRLEARRFDGAALADARRLTRFG
jgi:transcriptional regulator with GAF, ATPase, and Fis domain